MYPFPTQHHPARPANRGFALILTLLILCLLIIVVVSYLSSMSAELQTSSAFTAKVRAAQAAQAAVDSATAMLTESFRDFPDSATAWDAQQTTNSGAPPKGYANIVTTASNEGTSLYLRAVPRTSGGTVVANPQYTGTTGAANDPNGNNPNNLACQTFVLPLISGVPNGAARLASSKASIWPSAMKLDQVERPEGIDPINQNWTDLNVRRSASDIQGVIGSPPGWTGAPGQGPKPARAYWVNQTGSDGKLVGRYAFWMEDNSFRANVSLIDNGTQVRQESGPPPMVRVDNVTQPLDGSGNPRSLLPSDMFMLGPLATIDPTAASNNALPMLTVRNTYPGSFFPEAHAFAHASLTPPSGMTAATYNDLIGYVSTAQSGALNLTRHGTQRVNLDAVVPQTGNNTPADPQKVIQPEIEQIARTIAFHLPNFGQRFYRTASDFSSTTLNDATQVSPGRPLTITDALSPSGNEMIYLYKVATNIHDYIDSSAQPTFVQMGGTVTQAPITGPPGDDTSNPYWAQGKKAAPFIDEVAVRYRPIVATSTPSSNFVYPQGHFDLCVDYYVEVWNMSDRDVYAGPQSDGRQLHLNGAKLEIYDQQRWKVYPGGKAVTDPANPPPASDPLLPPGLDPSNSADELAVDLVGGVFGFDSTSKQVPLDGTHQITVPDGRQLQPNGIVFPAGSVTVLTTDPSCFLATGVRYPSDTKIAVESGANPYVPYALPYPAYKLGVLTPANRLATYYCSHLLKGQRHYEGLIQSGTGGIVTAGGLQFDTSTIGYFAGDISLQNTYGYIDHARNAIVAFDAPSIYTNTAKQVAYSPPSYNDWSYCSSLAGNVQDTSKGPSPGSPPPPPSPPSPTASELGDPRTNNEQISLVTGSNLSLAGNSDQTRFFSSNSTLGYVNNMTVRPDGTGSAAPVSAWPDYFTNGAQTGTYSTPGLINAPMVMANAALTSIGQLGDVFDPARLPNPASANSLVPSIMYSRGGGRTFKIGQHDDRYDPTPSDYNNGATPPSVSEAPSSSNGWASWRLTDIFSAFPLSTAQPAEPIELPARININGITRDNGAALRAALTGFSFQPATSADPVIHGDVHSPASGYQALAGQTLNLDGAASQSGLPEIVSAVKKRFAQAPGSVPYGPFFERGEFGELAGDNGQFLFGMPSGAAPYVTSSSTNTNLVNNQSPAAAVDMNKTFDRGREEMFRRLAELICTRGDTFTVYTVGQSLTPSVSANGMAKITGTHRMRVTFRLTPVDAKGNPFHPAYDSSGMPIVNAMVSSNDITTRFAKPDHYSVQVLETATY